MTAFVASQELHDLAFRYALAVDCGDAALLATLFTPDGGVLGFGENPIAFRGESGLRKMIAQVDESFDRTMHNVFNQLFMADAAGAVTGITYCIASHIIDGDAWQVLDMPIRYHNSYAQIDKRWRFHERRIEVLWLEMRPAQRFDPAIMAGPLERFQ